jgi:biotin-dependent carboxylase-like uncharacterized protein
MQPTAPDVPPTLEPFGDAAWRAHIDPHADPRSLLERLRAVTGVVDVVVCERHVLITFDPSSPPSAGDVEGVLARRASDPSPTAAPTEHFVRVRYDGVDLAAIAERSGLAIDEVVALHAAGIYRVAVVGFLPGFAYLRGIDPRLVVPRRASPRPRVPAHSVAVAGPYTGVYPFASPGGWSLVGTAVGFTPFDARRGAALAMGDVVRFVLEVMAATGLATVQDAGRPGFMHQGVPPGGALVPELLGAANAAVSNARDAAAVEVFGEITLSARGTVELACDGGERRALRDGESWTVRSGKARVAYVAVRGGLGVPRVLGGRGTLLVAGLGGHEGRALRRGDVLNVDDAAPVDGVAGVPLDLSGPIRLVLGPDAFPDGGLEALLASPFVVDARSDRTGVRLVGPAIAAPPRDDAAPSAPMARGAIQVPPSGQPIILGPDHPTTGGYPVIAVVVSADFGRLAARPIGSTVRFVACL